MSETELVAEVAGEGVHLVEARGGGGGHSAAERWGGAEDRMLEVGRSGGFILFKFFKFFKILDCTTRYQFLRKI